MVADAKAVEDGRTPRKVDPEHERQFRGSWSGYERDKYFHNPDGVGGPFFDASYVLGLDFEDDGRSCVPVDVDGDGDLDLAILSLQGLRLMENRLPRRNFARVRLVSRSTPSPIGARVRLSAAGTVQQDYFRFTDGFLTQVPGDLHFGLGDAVRVHSIEVTWPSGKTESWKDLESDRLIQLTEGDAAAQVGRLPSWPDASRPAAVPGCSPLAECETLEGAVRPLGVQGVPAVLNFWAPDCSPCKTELPILAQLHAERPDVAFAGICVRGKDAAPAILNALGVKYAQFAAGPQVLEGFFRGQSEVILPSTFVFDRMGRLRRVFIRPVEKRELLALLDTLRDEEPFAADLDLRGRDLLQQRRYKEAIPVFLEAERIRPGVGVRHLHLGMAWLGLKQTREAEQAFETAIRLDPDLAQAHANLGTARFALGRFAEAIASFETVLRIRGEDLDVLVNLGNAMAASKRTTEALAAFERALRVDPEDPGALLGKAKVLILTGKTDEARATLNLLLSLDTDHEQARALLRMLPR